MHRQRPEGTQTGAAMSTRPSPLCGWRPALRPSKRGGDARKAAAAAGGQVEKRSVLKSSCYSSGPKASALNFVMIVTAPGRVRGDSERRGCRAEANRAPVTHRREGDAWRAAGARGAMPAQAERWGRGRWARGRVRVLSRWTEGGRPHNRCQQRRRRRCWGGGAQIAKRNA